MKNLSHGGAYAPKDQLLAELEGCGQMTREAHHIIGLLSDFFVAGVAIRAPSTADRAYPIFYQESCVSSEASFVLRLLFVLLDLDAEDIANLLCESATEIAADDEASESCSTEVASAAAGGHLPPGEPAASSRQKVAAKERSTKGGSTKEGKFAGSEYVAAVREEEVQMAVERAYARRGLAYLNADELNRRNFAYVKNDVSALL